MKKNNVFNAEQFIQNSLVGNGCLCGNCCAICVCYPSNSGSGNADATADRAEDTRGGGMVPAKPIIAYDLRP